MNLAEGHAHFRLVEWAFKNLLFAKRNRRHAIVIAVRKPHTDILLIDDIISLYLKSMPKSLKANFRPRRYFEATPHADDGRSSSIDIIDFQ